MGELDWVPPMLGLEDEMIIMHESTSMATHYTGLINGMRAFVFNAGHGSWGAQWFVVVAPPNTTDLRSFGVTQPREFMKNDPLVLLAYLQSVTSGGNHDKS